MRNLFLMKRSFKNILSRLHVNFVNISTMSDVSKVLVRHCDKDETMKITFSYGNTEIQNQNFTFIRSKDETVEAAFNRMKNKIQAAILQRLTKKRRKSKSEANIDVDVIPININLYKNGSKIDESTKNINAWTADTELKINSSSYDVIVNPPSVSLLSLPKNIMCGFPIYPRAVFEFCTKEESLFKWYRQLPKDKSNGNEENSIKGENDYWKFISEGFFYITQESDIGFKLRVSCLPRFQDKLGLEEDVKSSKSVDPSPGKCPFEDRHKYTTEITKSGSFRYVSYNILADLYADTDTARDHLFSHCPVEFLDLGYRKQLYLKEIMGYNPDILCLQEVDRKVFHDDLVPFLSSISLSGVFNEKGGQVAEGLACFYRNSKFKLIESHSVILSEAIKTEAVLENIHKKILQNDKLLERFLSRTTALQVSLLESIDVPNKKILIGNTHLYFHPDSDNIRLIQAACCILYMEKMLNKYKDLNSSSPTAILSGDFNSCPEFGVYQLATEGYLPSSCIDWKSNPDEVVEGIDLSHSLKLNSACGIPDYTNYTVGFHGCLDYIFYDKTSLEVSEVVPFPSHEQVVEHTALPNKVFPSDHIALVCTLNWK